LFSAVSEFYILPTSASLWQQTVTISGEATFIAANLNLTQETSCQKSNAVVLEPLVHGQRIIKCINSVQNKNISILYVLKEFQGI
jgi:hypothetical protein